MHARITTSLIVLLLLLLSCLSSGLGHGFGFRDGTTRSTYSLEQGYDKHGLGRRKVVGLGAELDYDDGGANPKHDPRGKKPGNGGGKNP